EIKTYLSVLKESERKKTNGAIFCGVHLEGPWINPEKAGAQNREYIRPPNIEELSEYFREYPRIRMVTLAPEMPGALQLIEWGAIHGITMAVGHTNGNYMDAVNAWHAGASHATHLFNAMPSLHHREPSILGGILDLPYSVEMILDGVHIHPAIARLVFRLKKNKIALISDSIPITEKNKGYLGGIKVEMKEGKCYVAGTNTLAGSTLTMNVAAKNAMTYMNASLTQIANMTYYTPLSVIGESPVFLKYGAIKNGVVLDRDFNVLATIINEVPIVDNGIFK
ncbi:MAG: amidohydrolase family protein, partial [Candidatus Korarchaeota archaeon]